MKLTRTSGLSILIIVLLAPSFWLFRSQDQASIEEPEQTVIRENVQTETVDVEISTEQGAIATFTLENMLAGDDFRGRMIVQNVGSEAIDYQVTSDALESPLNQFMTMRFWGGGGDCAVESLPSRLLHNGPVGRGLPQVVGELAAGLSETLCAQIVLSEVGDLDAQKERAQLEFKILAIAD